MSKTDCILVATDFSDAADRALGEAVRLAKPLGAKVYLVHTYELPIYGPLGGPQQTMADLLNQIMNAGQDGLKAAADARAGAGVEIETMLRAGPAWEEINRAADEIGATMIVVGTHGRRGVTRALLGSVAERIIRTATRPVLVVHAYAAVK